MRVPMIVMLILSMVPAVPWARAEEKAAPDLRGAARQVMEAARFCTLVTRGADGRAEARIVDPFPPEEDMTVWLATSRVTRKVAQIRADPHVTLLYWDRDHLSTVTLLGDAEIVDDPPEKARRWKEEWAMFYSDGNRGADYLLVKVTPKRLDVLTPDLPPDPATWRQRHVDFP